MQPKCPQCGESEFASSYVEDAHVVIAHCSSCGHIVGVTADYQDMAKTVVAHLTRGARDAFGHPVVFVKQGDPIN